MKTKPRWVLLIKDTWAEEVDKLHPDGEKLISPYTRKELIKEIHLPLGFKILSLKRGEKR